MARDTPAGLEGHHLQEAPTRDTRGPYPSLLPQGQGRQRGSLQSVLRQQDPNTPERPSARTEEDDHLLSRHVKGSFLFSHKEVTGKVC